MGLPKAPLHSLAEDSRFRTLDRRESYYRGQQDAGKRYDWDGNISGYAEQVYNSPGWYVPHRARKPSSRYDLARVIVNRLTDLVFGQDHFPDIRVPGDEDAEDYVQELAKESRLKVKIAEARRIGGAAGTAVLSFGFVDGRPRVRVHNPKYITVLSWENDEEYVTGEVLKAFSYPRTVWDVAAKKLKRKTFWSVTYWTKETETRWREMPDEIARTIDWARWDSSEGGAGRTTTAHDYGFCPVYWIQNRPDSSEVDGEGDFEGLESTFDDMNQLLSATTKGTKANVDPTLVIKESQANNTGSVKKGHDNVIFSQGGAEYLELKGTAVDAAIKQLDKLRAYSLDVSGVVLADPEKLSGAAQSARALEILYAPMLANCDVLREQYGEYGLKPILLGMLRVAREYYTSEPVQDAEGNAIQGRVMLPPRMERSEDGVEAAVERTPGESENLILNWRPYFAPTWSDINQAATAMKNSNGGKPTVSQRTSVAQMSTMVGVDDVDEELERIEQEAEDDRVKAQEMMAAEASMGGLFDDDDDKSKDDKYKKPKEKGEK